MEYAEEVFNFIISFQFQSALASAHYGTPSLGVSVWTVWQVLQPGMLPQAALTGRLSQVSHVCQGKEVRRLKT